MCVCDGALFGAVLVHLSFWMHVQKLLPALRQGHVAHPFLCSQGVLEDPGDLGDQEDQQVRPGLGLPDGEEERWGKINK